MTGPEILADFAALPFERKLALAVRGKTRVMRRGYRGLTVLPTYEILALVWLADMFLDDDPAIGPAKAPAEATPPTTKGTEL